MDQTRTAWFWLPFRYTKDCYHFCVVPHQFFNALLLSDNWQNCSIFKSMSVSICLAKNLAFLTSEVHQKRSVPQWCGLKDSVNVFVNGLASWWRMVRERMIKSARRRWPGLSLLSAEFCLRRACDLSRPSIPAQ